MQWQATILLGVVLATSANVLAQSTAPNLPGFLSAVDSLASALEPTTTSSTFSTSSTSSASKSRTSSNSRTRTSSHSSTSAPSAASNSSPTVAAASATSSSTSQANNAPSGIDAHTRDIILGVTIPIGLILLALIILLGVLCCRRRQRRAGRSSTPESRFAGGKDWEHGDTSHHGYNSSSSIRTGHSNGVVPTAQHEPVSPVAANHHLGPSMLDQQAYNHHHGNPNAQNPFTPNPPITRKPVPVRNSAMSDGSGDIGNHHNSHHSGLGTGAAIGAGAFAGAAAMHHHNKHRKSDENQSGNEYSHRPLGSHPHDPAMYATAGPAAHNPLHEQRRTSTPFSPDDVGSNHRSSERFSQGRAEPNFASHQSPTIDDRGGIIAPTAAQRRSLQSRNSSYSDGRDTPRGPSRSPKRRSLSGGGEMWQADPVTPPARSTHSRNSNGDIRYSNPVLAPALPSNRHITGAQRPHMNSLKNDSNTNSSTSNDSWESAQSDFNLWDDRDTGRYPRFSGGSANSNAPLMPPSAAWDDSRERRWSGDMVNNNVNGNGYGHNQPEARRNSGGMERRRLRFSDGTPEFYNEQGLVGRAL